MKLSCCIIAKNEEVMIGDMLETVKEADEIVISTNDCTDKTVEIALKYTDKVFTDYKWIDDFSDARNYTLSKATGDWILCLDCDNLLEPGGIQKIKNVIEKTDKIALDVTLWSGNNSHKLPWLFKRCSENYYIGTGHEYLSTAAQGDSGVKIEYGYSPAHALDPDRVIRIMGKALEKNPELARERFYYAREFYYRGQWDKAIEEFDKYLKVATWLPEKCDALYLKSLCYWNSGRGEQARDCCFEAIKQNPDFQKALLLMSDMMYEPWKSKWKHIADHATNKDVLFT